MTALHLLFQLDIRHDYYGFGTVPVRLELCGPPIGGRDAPDLHMRFSDGRAEAVCAADLTGPEPVEVLFALWSADPDLHFATTGLSDAPGQVSVLDAGPVGGAAAAPERTRTVPVTARRPLAFVQLRVDPDAREQRFEARLAARDVLWTYHVLGGRPDAVLSIRDPQAQVDFAPLGARQITDGRSAQSFRSSRTIALRARPPQRFELVGEGPFGPRVILPVLPAPRPGPTGDIYVNLT